MSKIFKQPQIHKLLLRFLTFVDSVTYKLISKLAIIGNDGVHPKHHILNYHQFFLNNITSEQIVLDLGCGKGENAFDLASKAKVVVAIDIEQKNIDNAQSKYRKDNLTFLVGDATTHEFDTRFDSIVLSNVLEHIEDRVPFLKKLHTISDTIILRVPMIDRDWLSVYKKEQGLDYRLDPTHFTEYTMDELHEELANGGWKLDSYSIQFGECWGVVVKSTEHEG